MAEFLNGFPYKWEDEKRLLLDGSGTVIPVAADPPYIGEMSAFTADKDRVYLCDRRFHRIVQIEGLSASPFGPVLNAPFSIAISDEFIYICVEPDNAIEPAVLAVLDHSGSIRGFLVSENTMENAGSNPYKLYAKHFESPDPLPPVPERGLSPIRSVRVLDGMVILEHKNGATYTAPCGKPECFEIPGHVWCPVYSHTELATPDESGLYTYAVYSSTTADNENTSLEYAEKPGFENNVSYSVENLSEKPVTIRGLSCNGRDYSSLDSVLESVCGQYLTDEEKALAIWQFLRHYITYGVTWPDSDFRCGTGFSLTRWLNGFGSGVCGSYNGAFALLAAAAGIRSRTGSLSNGSHAVAEFYWDGKRRYLDALYGNSYKNSGYKGAYMRDEQGEIASYEQLCADHDLTGRAGSFEIGELASLFGYHDCWRSEWNESYADPCDMSYGLLPGQQITFTYDFNGGFVGNNRPSGGVITGYKTLYPSLSTCIKALFESSDVSFKDGIIQFTKGGRIGFEDSLPWPITGVEIKGILYSGRLCTAVTTAIGCSESVQDKSGHFAIYIGNGSKAIGRKACYRYELNFTSEDARFRIGQIKVYFQAYRPSLCSLRGGENILKLSADPGSRLKITHRFREVALPLTPVPVLEPHCCGKPFRWSDTDAERYEWILSDREDCAWPYAPLFNQTVDNNEIMIDCSCLLQPGMRHYWRIRAYKGRIWGGWSETGSFVWQAPAMPRGLEVIRSDRALTLRWQPVPDAVFYEIYGSDEEGFHPSNEPYPVWIHRTVSPATGEIHPANLVCRTDETSIVINGADKLYCYYRVRAVNVDGVRSIPTHFAALPHPFIIRESIQTYARIGSDYAVFPIVVHSLGQLYFNRLPDRPMYTDYHRCQVLRFSIEGPKWLQIRDFDGYLSGTPDSANRGNNHFVITAEDKNGIKDSLDIDINVTEDM